MDLANWKEYIPDTQTVNQDRKYYTCNHALHGPLFRKVDSNIKRGEHENNILRQLDHPGIPRVIESVETPTKHTLDTSLVQGQTLEVLIRDKQLVHYNKPFEKITSGLLDILQYMIHVGVTHNDINVSNVLFVWF